jgi:exodeoxyribonuclease VII large subunit
MIPEPDAPAAYTVTEVNNLAKRALERNFNSIYVVGEVTNLSAQPSGHVYFSLKDADSQLDAVMWRDYAAELPFEIEAGMEVVAFGDLTIYTRRGRYQLSVRALEPRGVGALEIAFRQLKDRLEKEGLFDPAHKKPLPFLPSRIALVTSPSGAAVRDMLKSIFDRFSRASVAIYPVAVQGKGASEEIAAALDTLNSAGGFDVIVVGRGGGSLEDLWAFNEEVLARAVYRSRIPVVSAVGHERDVTISDLVADQRAMTPTQVGELVVPDERELLQDLDRLRKSLVDGLAYLYERAADRLTLAWRHPVFVRPMYMIEPLFLTVSDAGRNLSRGMDALLQAASERLKRAAVALDALSPLAVLGRGYSITREKSGKILTDVRCLETGDSIETILSRGRIVSEVRSLRPPAPARPIEPEGNPNG